MDFKFYFDRTLNDIHISKHHVSKEEIHEFFNEVLYLEIQREDNSFESIAKLSSERYLKIIYRKQLDNTYFIITAFDIFDSYEKNLIEKELNKS